MPTLRPLTKSRFIKGWECPRKLFYVGKSDYTDAREGDSFLENLKDGGFQVGALAKLRFPGGTEIVPGTYESEAEQTRLLLTRPEVTIYEAAFLFGGCFIRADVAVQRQQELFLFEVKAKSWDPEKRDHLREDAGIKSDWKKYLYDIAFQYWVVSQARPDLRVVPHLCLANKRAVATVDGINQHFLLVGDGDVKVKPPTLRIEDLGDDLLRNVPVEKEVRELIAAGNGTLSFADWVRLLAEGYRRDEKLPPEISRRCKGCEFRVEDAPALGKKNGFDECWRDAGIVKAADEPRTPAFAVWRLSVEAPFKDRRYFVDELTEADCRSKAEREGRSKELPRGFSSGDRRWFQVEKLKRGDERHEVHPGLRAELESWRYPLHFIDFETMTAALPFHRGRRPYEQIAFQFSHHVVHASGRTEHAGEWISAERGRFPNFDFLRALKAQLDGDAGTVLRFATHENTVLGQIYRQLEGESRAAVSDRDELLAWIRTITRAPKSIDDPWPDPLRMVDMLKVHWDFYFNPRMGGSNSIKVLLPAVLATSTQLKRKHAGGFPSRNHPKKAWTLFDPSGNPRDPYADLEPIFAGCDEQTLAGLFLDEEEELREGGAAMMAFAKMQFTEMSDGEAALVRAALLRYCELDTLAMVLVWEAWREFAGL